MGSKKEEWEFEPGESRGTKTTTYTKDNGDQRIVTQNASKDFFGKHATDVIAVERKSSK